MTENKNESIWVKSGNFHTNHVVSNSTELFRALSDVCNEHYCETLDKNNQYKYRLINTKIEGDLFVGNIIKIRILPVIEKSLPPDKTSTVDNNIENHVDGSIRFLLSKDNYVVFEDSSTINDYDFECIIDKYVKHWIMENVNCAILPNSNNISMTLFKFKDTGLHDFLINHNKITKITYTIKNLDNPNNTLLAENLKSSMKDTNSNKVTLENKDGLNKGSETIRGMETFDRDGHITTKIECKVDSSIARYDTSEDNYDRDLINVEPCVNSFLEEVKILLSVIRQRVKK